jgi:4-hydroxy-4-methyl-2-oxoglutarate aldolase
MTKPVQTMPSAVARISAASLHEAAGRIGALPSAIRPVDPAMWLAGPAFPVRSPAGDNLFFHHALVQARPGDILVVDCSGGTEFGYWGEVMSTAASARRLGGLVLTGGVRDARQLAQVGFPVFCVGLCIRGTVKDPAGAGSLGRPVMIGDVPVCRGDLVVGDADGVVVIPAERAAALVARARARDEAELDILRRLRAGESTIDIYGLPSLPEPPQ